MIDLFFLNKIVNFPFHKYSYFVFLLFRFWFYNDAANAIQTLATYFY